METGRRSPAAHRPLTLKESDVHVWRSALDLPEVCVQALQETLTPDELARARRYRSQGNQDRFIVARGLLRTILAHYLDASPGRLRFPYGSYGKPALDCAVGNDIQFNLSHADDIAIYALARRRALGIDLERIRPHPI